MRVHLNKKLFKPFEASYFTLANAELKEIGWELKNIRTLNANDYFGVILVYGTFETDWSNDTSYGASYSIWPDGAIVAAPSTRPPPDFPCARMETLFRDWLTDISDDILRRKTAYKVSNMIRQELVAAVWRPDRVARRLEEGGWDAIENMEAV